MNGRVKNETITPDNQCAVTRCFNTTQVHSYPENNAAAFNAIKPCAKASVNNLKVHLALRVFYLFAIAHR